MGDTGCMSRKGFLARHICRKQYRESERLERIFCRPKVVDLLEKVNETEKINSKKLSFYEIIQKKKQTNARCAHNELSEIGESSQWEACFPSPAKLIKPKKTKRQEKNIVEADIGCTAECPRRKKKINRCYMPLNYICTKKVFKTISEKPEIEHEGQAQQALRNRGIYFIYKPYLLLK